MHSLRQQIARMRPNGLSNTKCFCTPSSPFRLTLQPPFLVYLKVPAKQSGALIDGAAIRSHLENTSFLGSLFVLGVVERIFEIKQLYLVISTRNIFLLFQLTVHYFQKLCSRKLNKPKLVLQIIVKRTFKEYTKKILQNFNQKQM